MAIRVTYLPLGGRAPSNSGDPHSHVRASENRPIIRSYGLFSKLLSAILAN